MKRNRSILWGIFGGTALLLIYFIIVTLGNSLDHAIDQFFLIWYWILILTISFGVQVGLYHYVKQCQSGKKTGATTEMAASGGASTISMVTCCAHHLVDVLPFLGLSAASAFLVKYQITFILIGVFSNLIGIQVFLGIIQKHHLYEESSVLKKILFFNMQKLKIATIIFAIFTISFSFITKFK